ncbi:MAG: hypothetical protein Ta2D_11170 [Rickettsiales bacterium]|nr:MAG: hypothetical protein Ta2D_11170 [Rickettsiales bacterium]
MLNADELKMLDSIQDEIKSAEEVLRTKEAKFNEMLKPVMDEVVNIYEMLEAQEKYLNDEGAKERSRRERFLLYECGIKLKRKNLDSKILINIQKEIKDIMGRYQDEQERIEGHK